MTNYTKSSLLKTKREIINQVEAGKLGIKSASSILGISRQGLWKLRKNYSVYGLIALAGRKRGPGPGFVPYNRTPEWLEEKVGHLYTLWGGVGPDTLLWIIKDYYHDQLGEVELSRSTVYRILVRRRLIGRQENENFHSHQRRYTKGYPGEELQLDTTEPYGKGRGVMFNIIDDYSRFKWSYFYQKNNSRNTSLCLDHFRLIAPFPVRAVRVDNGPEFKLKFKSYCQLAGIGQIFNPIHTPQHNGKVERLHRTVEEECLWRVPPEHRDKMDTVNLALTKHSQWYNTRRRHLGYKMNNLTPQQKIENWIIDNKTSPEFTREVNETLILYIPFKNFVFNVNFTYTAAHYPKCLPSVGLLDNGSRFHRCYPLASLRSAHRITAAK